MVGYKYKKGQGNQCHALKHKLTYRLTNNAIENVVFLESHVLILHDLVCMIRMKRVILHKIIK